MAQGFDRLAGFYDEMMHFFFRGAIRASQLCFLEKIPPAAEVFIIGGGTGWIVQKIWQYCPEAKITYLELSPKMLEKTRKKIPPEKKSQIILCLGDLEQVDSKARFDVVCTFFFIDLFPSHKAQMLSQKLEMMLKPKGYWLYADFEAEGRHGCWRRALILWMYKVCGLFCDLENTQYWDYKTVLMQPSLRLVGSRFFFKKLIRSGIYQKQGLEPK